jgi:hypothetical protein
MRKHQEAMRFCHQVQLIKPIIMKDKFINWFIDVTVWLAWFLIVSTALMAICLVPSFIVDVLCK